jgi:hypothetical protein
MAAGLGFKTFTTGEVLTAADTNGYLMQGILVFATAAARDAAITSPQEGQACYLKSTDAVLTYSGSAWVAVGGGGGMTLISTTTLTGSSVTLSSIPQTYKNLQLIIRNFKPATDGIGLVGRFNGDANARYNTLEYAPSSNNNTFTATVFYMGETNDNSVATGLTTFNVYDYTNTTTWKYANNLALTVNSTTTANFFWSSYANFYNQIDAISSIYLAPSSGNFTSGTALLYGVS